MMPTYIKQPRSLATSNVFEKFNLKPPLILSGWNSTNDEKRFRFEEQIEWTTENALFEVSENFILGLGQSDFHYYDKNISTMI